MKKNGRPFFLCALVLLLFILAGCGGEEAYFSSPDSSATIPFRGVVEDGPIAGAKISLRDQDGTYYPLYDSLGNANYEIRSDANGAFALRVRAGTDFSGLRVVAVGGIDRDTGIDFSRLEMRSPLGLFAGDVSAIVVSPLTTLVAELHEQGLSFVEAENRLRDWLNLTDGVNLAARPSTNLDLLKRTLLLSKIALEINAVQPFNLISEEIVKPNTALFAGDGIFDKTVLSSLGLDDAEIERIADLQMLLMDPLLMTPDDTFLLFRREELIHILDANFQEMLGLASPLDNQNYQQNIRALSEKILLAAGDEVFLLIDPIPSRLFRYIFLTYKLNTLESLTSDTSLFSATLSYIENDVRVALEEDPWVALLARSSAPNSVDSPLLLNELPANDNQKRQAYFYASDLSSHYQAEQLIGKVFDDIVNDAVLLKIVEGKANAGFIEEARTIIATQIKQSEQKATAYRILGQILINHGLMAEARDELLRARDLYFKVIDSKGKASASNTDTINLQETADSFRKAGYLNDAATVLQYLSEVARALVGNVAAYGRLVAGIKMVADAYIAAGDLEAAAPVVDLLYAYAQEVPANLSGGVMTYWTRVIYLGNAAKCYADLDNRVKVVQIYGQIQALRMDGDTLNQTGEVTWYLVPALVETLYRVGETSAAHDLANSIPAAKVNDQAKAFKLVATIEALNGNLDAAYGMVFGTYFPKTEDKVEVLTYKESNKYSEYIGLALIKAGRDDEARIALAKAEDLLAGMVQTTDQNRYTYLIQRGYVKVADLYFMTGDFDKAAILLQQARGVIDQIGGVKFVVDGLIDIALGFQQLGQPEVTSILLQEAGNRVDTMAGGGGIALPRDIALLYEALIKTYLKLDDKDHVRAVLVPFLQWSRAIHDPDIVYTGTANDDLAGTEVDYLLRAAKYMVSAGDRDDAVAILEEVRRGPVVAIKDPAKRLAKYIYPDPLKYPYINHLIGGYANARAYDQALALALGLTESNSRNQAIGYLADCYVSRDDFPESLVASIDNDGDGKPDFFHSLASAEEIAASGLVLDDDSDGDGIVDTLDFRPLFAD